MWWMTFHDKKSTHKYMRSLFRRFRFYPAMLPGSTKSSRGLRELSP